MKRKPFTLAVTYWIAIIVIAHFFAPPGYVWTQNTISELASQGHTYKWIMQAGLSGFGALVMLAVGMSIFRTKKALIPVLPVMLYGLGVFLSGIYCAAPIDPSIEYSVAEARLHSTFATAAGLSLSAGILWHIFASSNGSEKLAHTIFLAAVVGFSMLFGLVENGTIDAGLGIVQRCVYLSGFAWLIYQEHTFVNKRQTQASFQKEFAA
ncbi:MAG: DUF998 domain-containing protein [Chloroflexi bacterium]|nr:DUF998 domain-containing protein [Chloroflexota bacterium]